LLLTHAQDDELPRDLSITFADELSGFEAKTVGASDDSLSGGRSARFSVNVILDQGEASARAAAILAEARAMRTAPRFALPEGGEGIEPGSTMRVETNKGALVCRVVSQQHDGALEAFSAVSTDRGVFAADYRGLAADPEPLPQIPGSVLFLPLDLPRVGPDGLPLLTLAAFAEPWPGGVAVYEGSDAGTGALITSIGRQSIMGRLTAPLTPGTGGRLDRNAAPRLRLHGGGLETITREALLSGRNLAAIETSAGFELLQFEKADLMPEGDWRLSGLLRARRGTDLEASMGATVGARFVLLDGAETLTIDPDLWGTMLAYEAGPEGAAPGAYPFRSGQVSIRAEGARPYMPVHLKAEGSPGTYQVSWVRRSRIGGDALTPGDIPLGETEERYLVEVLDASDEVLETFDVTSATASVTHPQAAAIRVAQLSSSYGAGRSARLAF
jgi:hypothetical protein